MTVNNILIITASFPAGAGEGFLEEEFRALSARGAKIIVMPLWPRGSIRVFENLNLIFLINNLLSIDIFLKLFRNFIVSPRSFIFWAWRLSTMGSLSIRIKNLIILPKAIWLAHMVKIMNIQHIHSHWSSTTATCAMVAADMAGIGWSFTAHRWDIYENNILELKSCKSSFARFISERGLLDSLKYGVKPDKCVVIRMGVYLPYRENNLISKEIISNKFRIICAANLIPVKGHFYLFEAVAILNAAGIDVTLDLAGQGVLRNDLADLAVRLGIGSIVNFHGQIQHSKLLAMYASGDFDVFVLPSVDLGNGEHEGVPVSLLEAMAHNLLVVSTQTGSIEELLPRDIFSTVPGNDSQALANILRKLALDIDFRRSLIARQSELIANWSSSETSEKLLNKINKSILDN